MYENFADRARKVMRVAGEEAKNCMNTHISPEHILLAILKDPNCIAAHIIKDLGGDFRVIRLEVTRLIKKGNNASRAKTIELSPSSENVIRLAIKAQKRIKESCLSTQHLLLGLTDPSLKNSRLKQVLANLGLTHSKIKAEVEKLNRSSDPNVTSQVSAKDDTSETNLPNPTGDVVSKVSNNDKLELGIALSRILGQLGYNFDDQRRISGILSEDTLKASAFIGLMFGVTFDSKDSVLSTEYCLGNACTEAFATFCSALPGSSNFNETLRNLSFLSLRIKDNSVRTSVDALLGLKN